MFVMIGAKPNSGWLHGTVALDDKGFVLTGTASAFENSRFATTVPGIYAVGDVRSGSVKRVASAVGEGSAVVADIHRYLADFCEVTPKSEFNLTGLVSKNLACTDVDRFPIDGGLLEHALM